MPFNENKQLDPSQVQDRRGRKTTGRTVAVGGGGLTIVLILVYVLIGGNPADLIGDEALSPSSAEPYYEEMSDIENECQSGADANERQDCRVVGFVNSVQAFWTDELPNYGLDYRAGQTVIYSGSTSGACGFASSAVGPFYCPADEMIYIDLSFFDSMETRFGAQGGPFAEAYVIAHEYAHHVQNLFGVLNTTGKIQDTGPDSEIVYTELQADCLAGIWMHHAETTGYLVGITEEDIAQALDAAVSVGDDRIQQQSQGYIMPDAWTHGSSEQRQAALWDGFISGDLDTCNSPGWDE